jgi:hypothetical protein
MIAAVETRVGDPRSEPYDLPVSGSLVVARWATAIAGLSALLSAMLGLRFGQQGLYQSDDLLLAQVYGQDIVVLVTVLPLLAISVWRASRGSARGLIGWGGGLVYLGYWYHYLLGGTEFGPAYLVHLTLVASTLLALATLAARLDVERLAHRFGAHLPARTIGGFMAIIAGVFATATLFDIVERLRQREVLDVATRGVYTVDLTIMLPATIVAGILLWRRQSWGYVLAGPLLVNAALSAATLFTASLILMGELPLGWTATALAAAVGGLVAMVAVYLREVRV